VLSDLLEIRKRLSRVGVIEMKLILVVLLILLFSTFASAFPVAPIDGDTVNFRNPFFSFPHDSVVCGNDNCVRVCPEAFCVIEVVTNVGC